MSIAIETDDLIEVYCIYFDKDNNLVNTSDEEFREKVVSIEILSTLASKVETYTIDDDTQDKKLSDVRIDRETYKIPSNFLTEKPMQFFNENSAIFALKSLISDHFSGKKNGENSETPYYQCFSFRRGVYQGRGINRLVDDFMNLVLSKFKYVHFESLDTNEKLEIPIVNLNTTKIKDLSFINCTIPISGTNYIQSDNLLIKSSNIFSRFHSEESDVISQIVLVNRGAVKVERLNIQNDCRLVFNGMKENENTWNNNTIVLYDINFSNKEHRNSRKSDSLIKIQDFYSVYMDRIIIGKDSNYLDRMIGIKVSACTKFRIENSIFNRHKDRTNAEISLSNISIIDINDNQFITDDKISTNSGLAIAFSNIGELSEVNIIDNVFNNYTIGRFVGSDFSDLHLTGNEINKGDFLVFKGYNAINSVYIKRNTGILNKIDILSDSLVANDLSIMGNDMKIKGIFSIEGPYQYYNDNTFTIEDTLKLNTIQNLADTKKQELYINNTFFDVKNEINLFSSIDNSKLTISVSNLECKTYSDNSFTTVSFIESKIKPNKSNFNSFKYNFDETVIDMTNLFNNDSIVFRGFVKGRMSLDFREAAKDFYDILFEPDIHKSDEKWYLDINFKGNKNQNKLLNFKLFNTLENITCENNDYTFSTKINIYLKNNILIDKGCYFFVKNNNNIVLKLEEVIDSRISDCVYTTEGKVVKKKFNYGITN